MLAKIEWRNKSEISILNFNPVFFKSMDDWSNGQYDDRSVLELTMVILQYDH